MDNDHKNFFDATFDNASRPGQSSSQVETALLNTLIDALIKLAKDGSERLSESKKMPSCSQGAALRNETKTTSKTKMEAIKCIKAVLYKCSTMQSTIQTLELAFQHIGGGARMRVTLGQLRVQLDRATVLFRQVVENFDSEASCATSPSELIDYHTEYYHVFLDLARAFQSCHNSLSAVNDSYYDTGYLLHLRSFAEYLDIQSKPLCVQNETLEHIEAIQQHLMHILPEIDQRLTAVLSGLSKFATSGIPSIFETQKADISYYMTTAKLSAIISVVTTTAMYLSSNPLQNKRESLATAVNTFWIFSLLFGIASIANSLLAASWRRSPDSTQYIDLPTWAAMWIKNGPMISMMIALASFALGLCLFVFWDSQFRIIPALTTLFMLIYTLGLIILARMPTIPSISLPRFESNLCWRPRNLLVSIISFLSRIMTRMSGAVSNLPVSSAISRCGTSLSKSFHIPSRRSMSHKRDNDVEMQSNLSSLKNCNDTDKPVGPAVMLMLGRLSRISGAEPTNEAPSEHPLQREDTESIKGIERTSRAMAVRTSEVPQSVYFEENTLATRYLIYSSDGALLLVGNITELEPCRIYNAQSLDLYGEIVLPGLIKQATWSKSGEYILARLSHQVFVYESRNLEIKADVNFEREISKVEWASGEDVFYVFEDESDSFYKVDTNGNNLDSFCLNGPNIVDIIAAPDTSERLFCIMDNSFSGARQKTRYLISFDISKRLVECLAPIDSASTSLSVSRDGHTITVFYQSEIPPQLWRLVKAEQSGDVELCSVKPLDCTPLEQMDHSLDAPFTGLGRFVLELTHEYEPEGVIYSSSADGNIFLWSASSGALLRHIVVPSMLQRASLSNMSSGATVSSVVAWDVTSCAMSLCVSYSSGDIRQWSLDADTLLSAENEFSRIELHLSNEEPNTD